MRPRSLAIGQLVATMFLVALVTVLAKKSLKQVNAIDFVWLQMVFAVLSICLYSFAIKKDVIPRDVPWRAWLIVIGIGVCNFTLVRTLFILALDIMPVTTHAYIINFVGIVTMLLSAVILKEKPGWKQIVGALIAVVGIQIYFRIVPDGQQIIGLVLLSAAVLFLALTNILIRLLHLNYPQAISHNIVSVVAILSGGLPMIFYGLQYWQRVIEIDIRNWLIIAANGIIAMSLTMNVFNLVIKRLRAYEASILASTGLVFTALLSIPILNDKVNLFQFLGILLLLIGILMVQLTQKASK